MSSSVIGKRVYLTVYVSYEPLHSLPTAPSNFLNSRASASGYGHTVYFYQIVEREQRGMMHLPFRHGSALLLKYIVYLSAGRCEPCLCCSLFFCCRDFAFSNGHELFLRNKQNAYEHTQPPHMTRAYLA